MKSQFLQYLGVNAQTTTHKEKIISFFGGFLGIYLIYLSSNYFLGLGEAIYVIPSMGASAVLLFATPSAPFSQPWNVFGGHIFAAFIGVACYQLIPDIHIAAAASVGISIGVMYYANCIHPPGGATALAAVIGSSQIHELSYWYVITPVLINTCVLLLVAIAFNALFSWRRYPSGLYSKPTKSDQEEPYGAIKHEDFVFALSQIDSMVDISEEKLLEIYKLATTHSNISK